jgi:hypothetical protein
MTTIAYDGKLLAADCRRTCNDVILTDSAQKIKAKDDCFWALCGTAQDIEKFISLFEVNKIVSVKYDAGGFFIDAEKQIWLVFSDKIDTNLWQFKKERLWDNWADGSGSAWAIAAMDHGKNAINAIKYASTRDPYTSSTVLVLDIEKGELTVYK